MSKPSDDGLPSGPRRWAIVTLCLSILLAVMDASIANVALPTIATDLHTQPAASIWVVNAYQLATVIALLPLSSVGEIVGYGRVFRGGLVVFTLASVLCAVSHTLPELAASRTVQGFGAAGMVSMTGALIRFVYPASMLGRGTALIGMMVAAGAASGPALAGGILAVAPWPALFLINIPLGLLAWALARPSLPRTALSGRPFDFASAGLNAIAFGPASTRAIPMVRRFAWHCSFLSRRSWRSQPPWSRSRSCCSAISAARRSRPAC